MQAAYKVMLIAGPPAGGKGTQAKRMRMKFPIVHISTGDLLRAEAKTNKKLAGIMATGALVDDQYVFDALLNRLKKADVNAVATKGVLLDGFPRNKKQADMLAKANIPVDMFLLLDVDDAVCEKRVLGRAQAAVDRGEEPRKDDTSETIRARLKIYHDTIDAFSDCYTSSIAKISGNGTSDESWHEVNIAVKNLMTAGEHTKVYNAERTAVQRAAANLATKVQRAKNADGVFDQLRNEGGIKNAAAASRTRLQGVHVGAVVGRIHKAALGFEGTHHHDHHDWAKNYEVHHSSKFGNHDDLESPPC